MSPVRIIARRAFVALALLCPVLQVACIGNAVKRDELPESPIAIIHWDSESGRRRAAMLGAPDTRTPNRYRQGVAEIGRLNSFLPGEEDAAASLRYPGRLSLLNPRTGEITRIDQAPPGARPLSWSNDHKSLLFTSDRITGRNQIYSINVETEEVRSLTSGDERRIAAAYGKEYDIAIGEISRAYAGGYTADVRIVPKGKRGYVIDRQVMAQHLDFAPDGSSVVYAPQDLSQDPGGGQQRLEIKLVSTDESVDPVMLGPGVHPVYTPDSNWIVYESGNQQGGILRRVRPDGSGRTRIGEAVRSESNPAVSPDGGYVLYVSDHNGLNRLFIKRFDGTGDRLLYDDGAVAWPVW